MQTREAHLDGRTIAVKECPRRFAYTGGLETVGDAGDGSVAHVIRALVEIAAFG